MHHAARVCSQPGCPAIAVEGGRCARHQLAERPRATPSERGYGAEWQRIRRVFLRENPCCVLCGQPATDVDHIVPLSRGGTHDAENLQALCHSHHSQKTTRIDNHGFKPHAKDVR